MKHLYWFRNDLRIRDNSLLAQAGSDAKNLLAVYCFDPRQFTETAFGFKKTGAYRAHFLWETVKDLRTQLETLHIPLFIYFEHPEDIVPKLIEEHGITKVYFQKEWTSEEKTVADTLQNRLKGKVKVVSDYDQFLYHPEDIPYDTVLQIPKVFTAFRKKCEKYAQVRPESAPLTSFPKDNFIKTYTKLPPLSDLKTEAYTPDSRTAFPFKGGETAARERLHDYFFETQALATYKQTRNGMMGTAYSSKLSAWLANGSISARSVYWAVRKFEKEIVENKDTYWMIFELLWRDFFKYISLKHGNQIFQIGGILEKTYNWKQSDEKRQQWIEGDTPYDFVNAHMKEIAATGWMSNRGRQNVASYWAKECQQDWRIGASYFESMLIDYDVHSNWGNWMYNAGVGNDPRDRIFNIERQASQYDSNYDFRNLWLH